MNRTSELLVSAFLFCVAWLTPSAISAEDAALERDERPNVLMIVVDTLRADRLGIYGNRRKVSPNIDALASNGTLFLNARSNAAWTPPSMRGIFTGTASDLAGGGPPKASLGAELAKAGWTTAAFVVNSLMGPEVAEGFESYRIMRKARADQVVDAALEKLRTLEKRPYFLYLHFMDTHRPYDAPLETKDRFRDPRYDGIARYEADTSNVSLQRTNRSDPAKPLVELLGNSGFEYLRDSYDEEILYCDRHIGRLLHEMRALSLLDNTLVVFTSDHGEELGDHGELYHGHHLYDEIVRVPLFFVPPRRRLPAAKRSYEVGLSQIAPTILRYLGLPVPDTMEGAPLDLSIERPERPFAVFAGHTCQYYPWRAHGVSVIFDGFKLIERRDRTFELYDLNSDPGEKQNLISSSKHGAKLRELRELLVELKKKNGGYAPEDPDYDQERKRAMDQAKALREASKPTSTPTPSQDEPGEHNLEALRSLGYIN